MYDENDMYIKNIQKCYESGLLKESDLNTDEKIRLSKLYEVQIRDLEKQVEGYEKDLERYKERILHAKNRLNSK